MIALGAELARRGHDVTMQTWAKWEAQVEQAGMRFSAAPEYQGFPTPDSPTQPYELVSKGARGTVPRAGAGQPEVGVADIAPPAPALPAEAAGVPVATLGPHVAPRPAAGFPPYSMSARLPR